MAGRKPDDDLGRTVDEFGKAKNPGDVFATAPKVRVERPASQPAIVPVVVEASSRNNWQGILSLAFACTFILALPGLIFGILGVNSLKARTATNGSVTRIGLTLNAVWMGLFVLAGLGGALSEGGTLGSGTTFAPVADGACLLKPLIQDQADGTSRVSNPREVDCGTAHWGEVFYVESLSGSYPGDAAVTSRADDVCYLQIGEVDVKEGATVPLVEPLLMYPTEESWALGDRQIVCLITAEGNDLRGSVIIDN